jgi:hypothetical protein
MSKKIALLFDRTYIDAHHCFMELANQLVSSGFEVDLYMVFNPYNNQPFFESKKVRILPFPESKFQKIEYWTNILRAKDRKYSAIIATPIKGAWLARRTARLQKIPYYYLADELVKHLLDNSPAVQRKKLEKWNYLANKGAAATIALGEDRYQTQIELNKIDYAHDHIIIPNAPSGEPRKLRSNYFRDLFNIEDRKPILLFAGTLNWQLARRLYEETKNYSDREYHLVFHARTLGQMGEESHPFIKISTVPVPANMMNYVVGSADIGLALYDKNSLHETRNGITGGKLGTYLKNELPLIAGSAENLRVFADAGVGEYWDGETPFDTVAMHTIKNLDIYRKNIPPFYREHFQYEIFFETLLRHLSKPLN